ncbi:hypothetical protein ASG37_00875 [Sphingomonas sp. Leaf407]|uniref:hypothetical protein n=1 Tax=unclassified Sphingomonas TaxID=196159 RepID=UPI0006F32730|nr:MULTISPECIES: hypothetical protein [unclassified Sphingomonas]KQN40398.1 hypothetical protein ASE97_00905 [Sphingomonas sp. Leaf42]KQT29752.1 hypothetical protein ASG37_00875 [Sphingomonas sp. Leaf407]
MTTIRLVASLVLGLAIATPAIAAEPDTVATTTTAATAAGTTTAASILPASKTRYCVQLDLTGTRINRFRCETRRNWQAMGVDIDAMLKTSRR